MVKQYYFSIGLLLLCLSYLAFELFFNAYAIISVDEFWFAHRAYQYRTGLPYHDFAPYKTVLGYYLLLIPMLFAKIDILSMLITMKNTIAACNILILASGAIWLKRFFAPTAILVSLTLLLASDIVLFYSTNIRVDLFGYWFGFFSLLCLLQKRYLLAGVLLGLGFCTTQKAIWYLFASNCALAAQWLLITRDRNTFWNTVYFNLSAATVILLYLIGWSLATNWQTVIDSVFFEASAMYQLAWYEKARYLFWNVTLLHNPLLFLLWPLTLISLCVKDQQYSARLFVTLYASVILCCLIPYKQIFPYYMQVTIPIFFVLYVAFFNWLVNIYQSASFQFIAGIRTQTWWLMLSLYLLIIVYLKMIFALPGAYLFICLIALLIGYHVSKNINTPTQQVKNKLDLSLIGIILLFTGILYPLSMLVVKVTSVNGIYQKANLRAMEYLLQDGSDYVAGIELIYDKDQPIAGLRHLMGPAIDYLYHPTPSLRRVMLASLYEDPNATNASVIAALQQSKVKFYINNYRMVALPPAIKDYLNSQYQHWWGSIYLYAPLVPKGEHQITVKFSGQYRITAPDNSAVQLNHQHYAANSVIYLAKGSYQSQAMKDYRLILVPEQSRLWLDQQFKEDKPGKFLF
ncbi:MAG TPA: hypothetical protein VHZ76_06835 [Gammaproteobacteria bacterium]|jgi:hypothetical protein|nr:hypothetical protein [Gammaproteobacteria bacterium]